MSRDEMERRLISEGGWDKGDVEEALGELGIIASPLPFSTPSVSQQSAPREQPIQVLHEPAPLAALTKEEITPKEKILQVVHGGNDPARVQAEDDFLGLLQSTHIDSMQPIEYPPIAQEFIETKPHISTTQPLDELLAPVTMPSNDKAGALASMEVTEVSAPLAHSPLAQPAAPVSEPPAFTFNLAAIQGDITAHGTQEVKPLAQATEPTRVQVANVEPTAPAQKTEEKISKDIKTSSGAEAWLSGMNPDQSGTQGLTETQKITEEAKYPPRASVRSMSQDILLRGRGSSVPGMPAMVAPMTPDEILMSQTPEQKIKIAKDKEMEETREAARQAKVAATIASPTTDDVAKKRRIKKILLAAFAVVVLFAILGGAFAAFMFMRGPDIATLLSRALTNFTTARSLSYIGSASSSIVLSAASDGVVRSGDVNFSLALSGELKNDAGGFGDGNHRAHFAGGLHTGDYNWSTDVESDFRMIGDMLYFHVLSYPPQSDLDPEVFKTYWIKIDLPEIVKELALSGGALPQDHYGTLAGGGDKANGFMAIFTKYMPWKGGSKIGTEKVAGVDTVHIKLVVDKDALFQLVTNLYQKYTGKVLTLDADATIRMKDALAKTSVEVWVNPVTSTLAKIAVTGNYDDDIAGIHATGPISISFEFSRFNALVTTTPPQPLVTLDDLKMRMDDHKRQSALRAQDAAKVNALGEIESVLKDYHTANGKYPALLSDLRRSGVISSSTIPDVLYKQVVYAAYVNAGDYAKANKCTPKSKSCTLYHIGINLDDPTDPALGSDNDIVSDVRGADTGGCAGEHNTSCYDVVISDELPPSTAIPSVPAAGQ